MIQPLFSIHHTIATSTIRNVIDLIISTNLNQLGFKFVNIIFFIMCVQYVAEPEPAANKTFKQQLMKSTEWKVNYLLLLLVFIVFMFYFVCKR